MTTMASYEDVLDELYEVLRPFAKGDAELGEDTDLVGSLGLDSMKIMELLLQIEDRFDISIPLNVLPDVRTISDLAHQLHDMTAGSQ
jgi:acyl carrier protein